MKTAIDFRHQNEKLLTKFQSKLEVSSLDKNELGSLNTHELSKKKKLMNLNIIQYLN